MEGWISLDRQIWSNWVWSDKPFSRGQAWIDMLLLANHQDNKFALGNELVECERGEFITSEIKLMERWGWSKTKVRSFLKLLQDDKMIVKKTDHKKTAIKLVNYSVYQDSQTTKEPKKNHEETIKKPKKDTNNNVNNDNNENNKKSVSRFTPPTPEEVKEYCQQRGNKVDPNRFVDFYEARGWIAGKTKMKDWKAAVRTWEKYDNGKQQKPNNRFHNHEQRQYDHDIMADLMEKELDDYAR